MNEKSLIPSLRFAGFTDAWERRKVKCVAPLQRGFDLPKAQMETGAYPVVMSNGVNGYHVDYIVKGPGVITGRSGTIGRLHYIESNFWPHNTTLWVTNFYGNIPLFIYYIYQNIGLENYKSGSGVPTLNRNDIHDITVTIPDKKEQQSISSFFKLIDDLITLHQRKHEKLLHIKKSMLDKMFPKDGELFPEVRFAGFTAAWERRKLGEVTDVFRSGDFIKASDIYEDGEFPVYGGNGLRGFTNIFNYEGCYALIGRQGALCGNVNLSTGKAYFTEHAVAVHSNQANNTRFLFYLLEAMNLGKYSAQSAQPGLAVGKLVELTAMFPAKDEQDSIAAYLTKLVTLITLHQRKLEKLQNIKKACLGKMFV